MNSAASAPHTDTPQDPVAGAQPRAPRSGRIRDLTTLELGRLGEHLALEHLVDRGWTIVDRNVRLGRGELDIIALEGTTLVFVEVKTRRTLVTGVPQAAVTEQKVRQLRRLAGRYLMHHAPPHRDIRIDVIAVFAAQQSCTVEHLRAVV